MGFGPFDWQAPLRAKPRRRKAGNRLLCSAMRTDKALLPWPEAKLRPALRAGEML
jgi:hypothetical protein